MRTILVVASGLGFACGVAWAEPESLPPPVPLTCKVKTDCPSNATCTADGMCVEDVTPPPPTSPAPGVDTVVLKSGERVEGRVKEQQRGQFVVIESGGRVRTLVWDSIAEVIVTKETEERLSQASIPKPGTPAPTGKVLPITGKALKIGKPNSKKKKLVRVATKTGMNATKEGLGLQRVRTCTTADAQTCKETMGVMISDEGPKASYSSETDCSKTPGLDVCKVSKEIGVSGAGFGVSMTKEEVIAVDDKKRPSGSVNFSITALVGGGTTIEPSTTSIIIGNLDANLKLLFGGSKFPGKAGGGWVGFALEPTVGFVAMSITTPNGFGGTTALGGSGYRTGSSAGLQIMKFGKLDMKSLKQKGFGVFLGGFAGYQSITVVSDAGNTTTGSSSFGPELKLIFPKYNAGTAKYKSSSLNFMVLPTGDFIFFSAGAAFTF